MYLGRSRGWLLGARNRVSSKSSRSARPLWQSTFASSTIIWRNGNRRSNGARRRARARLECRTRWSISPPPTPGPATTRRPKRPWPNCRKSIPASPCRHMWAFISATTRPSTPNRAHRRRPAQGGAAGGMKHKLKAACGSGCDARPGDGAWASRTPCSHLRHETRKPGSGCDARRLSTGRSIRA